MSEDPRLNPAETEDVRRLLADARHTDPIPAPVADRLDRVLADLASEPSREATVVRLAERRRRAARMLIAAAAVVVVGLGAAQMVGEGAGPSAGPASEDAASDSSGGESAITQGEAAPSEETEAAAPQSLSSSTRARPYRIAAETFAEDAAALQSRAGVTATQEYSADDKDATGDRGGFRDEQRVRRTPPRAAAQVLCARGAWGQGSYLPVIYDGTPGWVVLRSPQGESQVADLFLCGSELAVRSVTLPLP